ncbi:MAG: phenylalanine--tRNA ligase subunit beta [Candidatus Caldarchaeum sp.]
MPVVNIDVAKLRRLVGRDLTLEEISDYLAALGMSVEEVGDILRVEYNPNRPDFSSVYGVAAALRGYLGIEAGLRKRSYPLSGISVYVDRSVEDIRPYIVCAVVRYVELSEAELVEFIAMQEDLHWVIGRNRRKMAIGLHDLSAISPPFTYKAVGMDEVRFVPLKDYRAMTPGEVLSKSEIGRKHAWLLKDAAKAPVIVDSRGQVFSMPPIVNASITELTPGKRDIFIDVTGTDMEKVNQALNILAEAFADAGGKVQRVRVVYGRKSFYTPETKPLEMMLDMTLVQKLTGLQLSPREAAKLLRRMGMQASVKGKRLRVFYPRHRADILHPVDLVEDIAVAYGYNNMTPVSPQSNTYGSLRPQTTFYEKVAEIMLGLGYTEVHNLMLTNEQTHYQMSGLGDTQHVILANPATREYTMVRTSLIPSLLTTLANNTDNLYPQKIFEIGDIIYIEPSAAEKTVRMKKLAAATAHAEAGYSEVKSVLDELFKLLQLKPEYVPEAMGTFIEGRCAALTFDGTQVGVVGEVSPTVLENFGIEMPVAIFEIELDKLYTMQQLYRAE